MKEEIIVEIGISCPHCKKNSILKVDEERLYQLMRMWYEKETDEKQ